MGLFLIQVIEPDTHYRVLGLECKTLEIRNGFDVKGKVPKCNCSKAKLNRTSKTTPSSLSCIHEKLVMELDPWAHMYSTLKLDGAGALSVKLTKLRAPLTHQKDDIGIVITSSSDESVASETTHLGLIPPMSEDVHWGCLQEMVLGEGNLAHMAETAGITGLHTLSRFSREIDNIWLLGYTPSDPRTLGVSCTILERVVEAETALDKLHATRRKAAKWAGLPKPEGYYVDDDNWEILTYCLGTGKTCALFGPTGCGKTELVAHVADAVDIDMETYNFGDMSRPRSTLLGKTHLDESGTIFNASTFIHALQRKCAILADEFTRAKPDAWNIINPLIDRQGFIRLDESREQSVVYTHNKMAFVATANVGVEYTGTIPLDRAMLDRFAGKVHLDYAPHDHEVALLHHRYPLPKVWLKKLVSAAWTQRGLARDEDYNREISTRMLLDACMMVFDGVTHNAAIRSAIIGAFDADERPMVVEIFIKRGLLPHKDGK